MIVLRLFNLRVYFFRSDTRLYWKRLPNKSFFLCQQLSNRYQWY